MSSNIPKHIEDYCSLLGTISTNASDIQVFRIIQDWNLPKIDQFIENLENARNQMALLCDPDTGIIKDEVVNEIAKHIEPDSEEPDENMEKSLSCLRSIIEIVSSIAVIDAILDKTEPKFFKPTVPGELQRIIEKPELKTKFYEEYLQEGIIQGKNKSLKRITLLDLVHDCLNFINKFIDIIKGDPRWGNYDNNDKRMDKFIGENAPRFYVDNGGAYRIPLGERVRIHIGGKPDHYQEFKEMIIEKLNKFRYLLPSPAKTQDNQN